DFGFSLFGIVIPVAATFNNLILSAGKTYTFSPSIVNTINGTLTANGGCNNLITLKTLIAGTQTTLTSPVNNVTINNCSLRDINAGVTGETYTAVSSVDASNNTNWIF